MSHTVRAVLLSASLFSFLLSASVANAQETGIAPQAPVPSQLITAKKVFISNGGVDAIAFQAFRRLGNVHQPYDAFYSAMSSWGKYTLVAAPAEADLVFEIRFTAPFDGGEHAPTYLPQFNLTIFDAKTRFVLWTILTPVSGAFRRATFVKNVNEGIATLVANLNGLK